MVKGKPDKTEQLRLVDTPAGSVTYLLVRKRVKNLNLRVGRDGVIALSVPLGCSLQQADELIKAKSDWLLRALARRLEDSPPLPPMPDRAQCVAALRQAVERMYPLVAPLGVGMPQLKVRSMKSQWGNCHYRQNYITLNLALAQCPEGLRDYVALHELVHFLHHDHGSGFYQRMDALMPDWKGRRKQLQRYASALGQEFAPLADGK